MNTTKILAFRKPLLMIALLSIAPALGVVAQDKLYKDEFPLGDITLLDGPLKHARDLNVQVLLKYDCDRMLAPYRKEAGLQPRNLLIPTGMDWMVMWADIICRLSPSMWPQAMRNAASAWNI